MSRIAGDPRVPHRRPPIELVTSIVAQGAAHASHDASDPIARAVAAHVPALRLVLDRLAGDADPAIRDVAAEARRYLDAATAASGGRPARRPD
jgi:hypothetical protein